MFVNAQSDSLLGMTKLKDAFRIQIWNKFRVRQGHLNFGELLKNLLEEYHLQFCRKERASNVDLRFGYILYSIANFNYIRQWSCFFFYMGVLLTQTIETDIPDFYSFDKWLWKRYFIFCQCWGTERQSGRGNHWYHERDKQMKHTSSKSYAWCSLEPGLQSCMKSEMLSSSFLGSPNIFNKGASL